MSKLFFFSIKCFILLNNIRFIDIIGKFNNKELVIKKKNNKLFFFSNGQEIQNYSRIIINSSSIDFLIKFEYIKLVNYLCILKPNDSIRISIKDTRIYFSNKNTILSLNFIENNDINKCFLIEKNIYLIVFNIITNYKYLKFLFVIKRKGDLIFKISLNKLVLITFDEYRIIKLVLGINTNNKIKKKFLINKEFIRTLLKLDINEKTIFKIKKNKLFIYVNKYKILGFYIKESIKSDLNIKYNIILPNKVFIKKYSFIESIKKLSIAFNKSIDWLRISIRGNIIFFRYKNFDNEGVRNYISLSNPLCCSISLNINYSYLKEFLLLKNNFNNITLYFKDNKGIIKLIYSEFKYIEYYIMPIYF